MRDPQIITVFHSQPHSQDWPNMYYLKLQHKKQLTQLSCLHLSKNKTYTYVQWVTWGLCGRPGSWSKCRLKLHWCSWWWSQKQRQLNSLWQQCSSCPDGCSSSCHTKCCPTRGNQGSGQSGWCTAHSEWKICNWVIKCIYVIEDNLKYKIYSHKVFETIITNSITNSLL